MISFFSWYLLITFLGLITYPLTWRLFPALSDRGYSFSRALGLLFWGFIFWLGVSLGIIQNDPGGLGLSLLTVLGLSGWLAWKSSHGERTSLFKWIGEHLRMIGVVELIFFITFAIWSFVRATNPEITSSGGEKTMELAFINAIIRSPTFPPHDPWLSGYAISYYYFGYVLTAMVAEATGVVGSVAHNLMLALVFSLSAIGAYGIVYNLLEVWRKKEYLPIEPGKESPGSSALTGLPILGPIFLLIISNLEGFLEVLHTYGLFWPTKEGAFNFWVWLDIQNLNQPPTPGAPWPLRFWWWWRASRVIQDFDLAGIRSEIIDEFPFFSYLLGDLHPHVLAMPFGLLAISAAMNIFLGGWDREHSFGKFPLKLEWKGILCCAVILGGLAFLNTWDILASTILVLGAFLYRRILKDGWEWTRIQEVLTIAIPIGVFSILFYFPFYLGFSSQAGGILPNLVNPTRGIQFWVMFGSLLIPIFLFILYARGVSNLRHEWKLGMGSSAGLVILLWLFSWFLGWYAWLRFPSTATGYLQSQNVTSPWMLFIASGKERLSAFGGLFTLFLIIGLALTFLISRKGNIPDKEVSAITNENPSTSFVFLLILLGGLLILAPEFIFLRDNFGNRMNTVFKFYYQGWEVWSLAAAFGVAALFLEFRSHRKHGIKIGVILLVLLMAMVYPVLGLSTKTNNLQISSFLQRLNGLKDEGISNAFQKATRVWTLDGSIQFAADYPSDAEAARWLAREPLGVITEAVGSTYSSYQDFSHISTYSGLPTVIGWGGHELQWRGNSNILQSKINGLNCQTKDPGPRMRSDDIRCLYETNDWETARFILDAYHVNYIYIGTLERSTYNVNETKFKQYLKPVFQNAGVIIYHYP